jgi:RNA polymerase sigma factor (sigma-70 family)
MYKTASRTHRRSRGSTSPETLYFNEVAEHELISAEEEVRLSQVVEQGQAAARILATAGPVVDGDVGPEALAQLVEEGDQASRHLIEANLRLVVWIARRYVGLGLPLLDLVQEGNIGLQQAVWHFDWRRGVRFSTYAFWWIRQGIVAAVRSQARPIRLPAEVQSHVLACRRAEALLREELGREPTLAEVARHLGVSEQAVDQARLAIEPVVSLEAPSSHNGDYTWEDVLADENDQGSGPSEVARYETTHEVQTLLDGLDTYERSIVALRFGLNGRGPYSVRELAEATGVSRAKIREVLDQAIAKLRREVRGQELELEAA